MKNHAAAIRGRAKMSGREAQKCRRLQFGKPFSN